MSYTKHKGLDASHWNSDPIDMHNAQSHGIEFWFEKAAEKTFADPTFADRQSRVRSVFPVRGWYYFCHCDGITAEEQGDFFAKTIGTLQEHEYAVFDVESGWGSLTNQNGINYLVNLIEAYKKASNATNTQIIIYGSLGWLRGQFGDSLSKLTAYHLWAARYNSILGTTAPWSAALIWQYSEHGSVLGVGNGSIDMDVWLDEAWPILK